MKLLWVAFCFLGVSAWAADGGLPARLECQADVSEISGFTIWGLNTDELDSTIRDTSLLDFYPGPSVTRVSFSNQCDNNYEITFYTDDLHAVASGTADVVKELTYYYYIDQNAREFKDTVVVSCRRDG